MPAFVDLRACGRGRYNLPVRFDATTGSASSASSPRRSRSPSGNACPCPHACSAPTVFAARRARIRSITPTVRRLGAALVRALPAGRRARAHRARHARVGRLDRARARARRPRVRRGRSSAPASSRRRPSPTSRAQRLHGRRRDLGVAQSVRRQRHQGVLGRRREVHRGARARRSRAIVADPSWTVPTGEAAPVPGEATRRRATSRTCATVLPDPGALGRRRASASTAPTARRRRWRRGCSASSGSTSTCIGDAARRPEHQPATAARRIPSSWRARCVERRLPARRGLRRRRRPRDLRRRARAASSTATPCMLMCARQLQARGPAEGQRDRRHGDEQHRPRARAARARASTSCAARSATST